MVIDILARYVKEWIARRGLVLTSAAAGCLALCQGLIGPRFISPYITSTHQVDCHGSLKGVKLKLVVKGDVIATTWPRMIT